MSGEAPAPLNEARLREPLRAHLAARASVRAPKGAGKASAVLVPLFERSGEVHVWLVRRASGLRQHGGQVAFPGGKRDPEDDSLLTTALREAHEEVGLARAEADILGMLDDYLTITGFTITPFVGWVRSDLALTPNEGEVARVFAAPVAAFFEAPTGIFPRHGYKIDGELVWGATAAIARGLGAIIREVVDGAG
jgi:8-oxo-dGTP pyrophosphatase MutT (NUDIX family)